MTKNKEATPKTRVSRRRRENQSGRRSRIVRKVAEKCNNKLTVDLVKRNEAGFELELRRQRQKAGCGGEDFCIFGNKPLNGGSKAAYAKHASNLLKFTSDIGAYRSQMCLRNDRPKFCPPIDPEVIFQFINYKRGKKGEPLMSSKNGSVLDVYGNEIKCTGAWVDPKNVKQLLSSIGAIHQATNNTGPYYEACTECLAKYDAKEYNPCDQHYGRGDSRPQLWHTGDSRTTSLVKNQVSKWAKAGSGYVSNGDSPFTPMELIRIRAAKINTCKLIDLQFYVMVLMACKLFVHTTRMDGLMV